MTKTIDKYEIETRERVARVLIKHTTTKRNDANDIAQYMIDACTSFAIMYDMFCALDDFNDDEFNERVLTCFALIRKIND